MLLPLLYTFAVLWCSYGITAVMPYGRCSFLAMALPIGWLQVGQSYSHGGVQSEQIPPLREKRCAGTSTETETPPASSSRRCKAADYFCDHDADVGRPNEGNDDEAKKKKKKRNLCLSDDTDSGRDTIERHHKRGTKTTIIRVCINSGSMYSVVPRINAKSTARHLCPSP